jgi:endonuclease-3
MTKNKVELEEKLDVVFKVLKDTYPETTSSLLEPRSGKPIDVLVATILSQATNDKLSERAFQALKEAFPSWEKVLSADPGAMEDVLAVGGLQREKTKKIQAALAKIKDDYGVISLDFLKDRTSQEVYKYLMTLPGVGPKTAACVMVFGFGIPAFPVDTHVYRIARRLGLVKEKSASKAQETLESYVPPSIKKELHVLMIEHGRKMCFARNPKCQDCGLSEICLQKH